MYINEIRKGKPETDNCSDAIDMDRLAFHFSNKFQPTIFNYKSV